MMENPGAANTSNPLSDQARPEQGSNPLSRIAPPMGGQPQPMPTPNKAQTVAAVKRLSAVQAALREVLDDKNIGKANVRPVLLDQASKLIGSRLMSLPETMQILQTFPEDPIEQKEWTAKAYNQAERAEAFLLDAHGSAIAAGKLPPDGGQAYDPVNHDKHFQEMLGHFKR